MEETTKKEPETVEEQAAETVAEEKTAEPKPKKKKEKKPNEWEEKFNAEHDQYLRLYAEYDNFRKRTAREKDRLYGDGVAKAVATILPAIDNLERAIAAAGEDEGLKSDVEMTLRQLMDCLKSIGVTAMGEKGEIFDPNRHEAIMHIEDEEYQKAKLLRYSKEDTCIRTKPLFVPHVLKQPTNPKGGFILWERLLVST